MDCNRKTAYFALKRIWENDAYSQMALDLEIKKYRPENPAFVRELVLGTLTWQRRLDYYLRQLVKKGYRKLPLSVLILLRMGAYEILMIESIPDYAAVNESVRLADHFAHRHVSFVNGVLRNLSRKKEILRSPETESDPVIRLCESYSYEEETVRCWIHEYGEIRTESVLASLNQRRPLYITINTLKTSPKRFQEEMEHRAFAAAPSDFSPFSFRVKGSGIFDSPEYKNGLFYVQDPASLLAVTALSPDKGDAVLDVCASPGGKSKAVEILTEGEAYIDAFDVYPKKAGEMRSEFNRLGMKNVTCGVRNAASNELPNKNGALYDKIIADVPCSGLGVIARRPEIKYKNLSLYSQNLPDLQYTILEHSSKYLRCGGRILYSTCTIRKEENQDVIRNFIRKYGHEFRIISERQLMPDQDGTDGFYFCILERVIGS